jgi:hypothetical protein
MENKQAVKIPPLIYGQRILLLEKIQHYTPPVRFVGPLVLSGERGVGMFTDFDSD